MPPGRAAERASKWNSSKTANSNCHAWARFNTWVPGSRSRSSPCSATNDAPKEWYVETVTSASGHSAPTTRWRSSAAALLLNVNPSTAWGSTFSSLTRWAMRSAITVVLPEPAPATTSRDSRPALMTASCSSVKRTSLIGGHLSSFVPQRAEPVELAVVAVGVDVGFEALVEDLLGDAEDALAGGGGVAVDDLLLE